MTESTFTNNPSSFNLNDMKELIEKVNEIKKNSLIAIVISDIYAPINGVYKVQKEDDGFYFIMKNDV